jgi:hypothetical protein
MNQGLYQTLKALGLPQGGLHGFGRVATGDGNVPGSFPLLSAGKWTQFPPLNGLYSAEIPLEQVRAAFSSKLLKKMESEVAP